MIGLLLACGPSSQELALQQADAALMAAVPAQGRADLDQAIATYRAAWEADAEPHTLARLALAERLSWQLADANEHGVQALALGETSALYALTGDRALQAAAEWSGEGDVHLYELAEGEWGLAIGPAAGLEVSADPGFSQAVEPLPPLVEVGLAQRGEPVPIPDERQARTEEHLGWVQSGGCGTGCTAGAPVELGWLGVRVAANPCAVSCDPNRLNREAYVACAQHCGGGEHEALSRTATGVKAACTGQSMERACEVRFEVRDQPIVWAPSAALHWLPHDRRGVLFPARRALELDLPGVADTLLSGTLGPGAPYALVDWMGTETWTALRLEEGTLVLEAAGLRFVDGLLAP